MKKICKHIASVPMNSQNPYLRLFYNSLCKKQYKLVSIDPFVDSFKKSQIDIVHIHWPEFVWRNFFSKIYQRIPYVWRFKNKNAPLETFLGSLFFMRKIKSLKKHALIVWTCHNIEPHEKSSFLEKSAYKYLATQSNLIIFHSVISMKEFDKKFKTSAKKLVMYHGNYIGIYPKPRNKNLIFSQFNLINSKPIVLMIGSLRQYKGIDIALDAAVELENHVQFIFAGNPHPNFDIKPIKNRIKKIPNATYLFKHLNDQEFIDLLHYSDISILPYRKITSSGALLASLSFGNGVITSDLPFFREILCGHKNAGLLVEANNPSALAKGILSFLKIDSKIRKKAAKKLAKKFDWDQVVSPVIEALDNLTKKIVLRKQTVSNILDLFIIFLYLGII